LVDPRNDTLLELVGWYSRMDFHIEASDEVDAGFPLTYVDRKHNPFSTIGE